MGSGGPGLGPKRGSLGWRNKCGRNEMNGNESHGADGFTHIKYSLKTECRTELRDTCEE